MTDEQRPSCPECDRPLTKKAIAERAAERDALRAEPTRRLRAQIVLDFMVPESSAEELHAEFDDIIRDMMEAKAPPGAIIEFSVVVDIDGKSVKSHFYPPAEAAAE